MSILTNYLSRYSFREKLLTAKVDESLGLLVVIPAHDENELITSVSSLQQCEPPNCAIEVVVVFNASEISNSEVVSKNDKARENLLAWYEDLSNPNFKLYCIEENSLPKKHAGVGLARKIGMDEAVRRFNSIANEDGVIVCFDADSQCDNNYFKAIEKHFEKHDGVGACSIHFEHPLTGSEFSEKIYQGVEWYELHLRYYKNGLAYAELPFAYHTIGSSMAVRAKAYCEQGGMNRRKAGEDFYFLQKFISVRTLNELKTTRVIPSPRASHRVPFGTGRAIQEMLDDEREIEKSYAFECFETLRECFENVKGFYYSGIKPNDVLLEFVGQENWDAKMVELKSQSTTEDRFETRFFQWFNAFHVLKFIHFLRDNYYTNNRLEEEVPKLMAGLGVEQTNSKLIEQLRKVDLS